MKRTVPSSVVEPSPKVSRTSTFDVGQRPQSVQTIGSVDESNILFIQQYMSNIKGRDVNPVSIGELLYRIQEVNYTSKDWNILVKEDLYKSQLYLSFALANIIKDPKYTSTKNAEGINVLSNGVNELLLVYKPVIGNVATVASNIYRAYLKGAFSIKNNIRKPMALLKVAKQETDEAVMKYNETLLFHEIAIGFALNSLRSLIPFFCYTYNAFYCFPPSPIPVQDGVQKGQMQICVSTNNKDSLTVYSAQEYIAGSKSLHARVKELLKDSLTDAKIEQAFSITKTVLLMVAHALNVAQGKLMFVHYDLHSDNVILRRIPKMPSIPLDGTDHYDNSYSISVSNVEVLPVIIDFGKSVCMVDIKSSDPTAKEAEKHVLLNPSTQFKRMEYLEDLNTLDANEDDPTNYFTTGYDIYRYVVSSLSHLNNLPLELPFSSEQKQVFNSNLSRLFRLCLQPFVYQCELHENYGFPLIEPMLKVARGSDADLFTNFNRDHIRLTFASHQDKLLFDISLARFMTNVNSFSFVATTSRL